MATVTLAAIRDFIGQDLGRSRWVTVDQSMIDQFAACTGDSQWIHVDADRASKESTAGGTIAHGFLSLSLIAPLGMDLGFAPVDASAVFNYGLDKGQVSNTGKIGQPRTPSAFDDQRRAES